MILSWQNQAWKNLTTRRAQLPHALLLIGKPGLGKSGLAQTFAQGLFCTAQQATGLPCGNCQACGWFSLGNHPDYRLIQPDSMAPETEDERGKVKKKSNQIRIEQIRELETFLSVGTHRGGLRIILVDPADTMNTVTQNALLKSLEEPPPASLFLLVTSRPQRLLATIRSRCQLLHVSAPPAELAEVWLTEQGVANPAAALAAAAGAPLAALSAADWEKPQHEFLSRLQEPRIDPLWLADMCNSLDPALVVNWLQRWVYDLLQLQAAGTVRYHRTLQVAMERIAAQSNPGALCNLLRRLAQARALASHPLNPRLFFEHIFLEYQSAVGS